jgi:ankyrin repeat protein
VLDSEGRTPLHLAARAASVTNCAQLLDHGAEVNRLSSGGSATDPGADAAGRQAPLHLAVASLSLETIRTLVHKGALVNQKDGAGLTPLMHSAMRPSSLDISSPASDAANAARDLLLTWGGDLFMQNRHGRTALHVAARHGSARAVATFLSHGALIDALDATMATPLMLAVAGGHRECARLLLDRGASTHAADVRRETALHKAARHGSAEFVTWLIDAGADRGAQDVHGLTPYGLAFCTNHLRCADLLYSDTAANPNGTQQHTQQGHTQTQQGQTSPYTQGETSPQTHQGSSRHATAAVPFKRALASDASALVVAIAGNDLELVAHLLRSGAAADARDAAGWRPLHEAVLTGNTSVARLLLRASPKCTSPATTHGVTPLHLAAWLRNAETALLLLSSGANVNAANSFGETPLHYACSTGSLDVISLLIHSGA